MISFMRYFACRFTCRFTYLGLILFAVFIASAFGANFGATAQNISKRVLAQDSAQVKAIAKVLQTDDWNRVALEYGVYTGGVHIFNSHVMVVRSKDDAGDYVLSVDATGHSSRWLEILTFGKVRFNFSLSWQGKYVQASSESSSESLPHSPSRNYFIPKYFTNHGDYGTDKEVFWNNDIHFDDAGKVARHSHEVSDTSYLEADDWVAVTDENIARSTDPLTPFMDMLANPRADLTDTCNAPDYVVFAGATVADMSLDAIRNVYVQKTDATSIGGAGAICTFNMTPISGYREAWKKRKRREYARDLYFVSLGDTVPPVLSRAVAETKYFDIYVTLNNATILKDDKAMHTVAKGDILDLIKSAAKSIINPASAKDSLK